MTIQRTARSSDGRSKQKRAVPGPRSGSALGTSTDRLGSCAIVAPTAVRRGRDSEMRDAMRLAIATCRERPEPQADDALMLERLDGIAVFTAPWDAPDVRWRDYDAVLLRSVWDYHRRFDEFLAWIASVEAAEVPVWNPPSAVRWNARKTYLKDLEAAAVPTVPTLWLDGDDLGAWSRTIDRSGWDEVVLKPIVGASSYLTWRSSAAQAIARRDRLARLADHGGALLQPFLPEIETVGEWSLIYFGDAYSHAVRKRAKAGEFRVQLEFGGSEEPENPPSALRALARAAIAAAPTETLYARVDLIELEQGPMISELELIEPVLFLGKSDGAARRFATVVTERLRALGS